MLIWFVITVYISLLLMNKQKKLLLVRNIEKADLVISALLATYSIIGLLFIIFLLVYDESLDAILTVSVLSFIIGLGMYISVLHNYRTKYYLTLIDTYLKYLGTLFIFSSILLFNICLIGIIWFK